MKKQRISIQGHDGSFIRVETTKMYSKKQWEEGKCWAFWCDNPFYFIHLNRNGKATHAYCYHIRLKFPEMTYRGERWCHIENGKLIIDKEKK